MDTVVAENIKTAIVHIKAAGQKASNLAGNFEKISKKIYNSEGTIGSLISDTSLFININKVVNQLQKVSDTAGYAVNNLSSLVDKVKSGEGSVGNLLTDTTFAHNLNKSVESINDAAKGFDENMEALKHNILLRRYYRREVKK
jgi:phospholipid/cholesterol/gamma-HCH transport system substrate-binding protein